MVQSAVPVYMNTDTLTTLDERQYYNGFAEAMKSAIIKDYNNAQ